MILKAHQIESYLDKPEHKHILLFGQDTGSVSESARRLANSISGEVHIYDASELKNRFNEILTQISSPSLFGPPGIIRLINSTARHKKQIEELFNANNNPEGSLIVEAGDLSTSDSLRKFFDKKSVAIPHYRPEISEIKRIIKNTFDLHGKKITTPVLDIIAAKMPPDRLRIKNEIEKLIWAADNITEDIVEACLGDDSEFSMNQPVLYAMDGNIEKTMTSVWRLIGAGESGIALLRIAQQYVKRIIDARKALESGQTAKTAVSSLRPPVFFKERPRLEAHIQKTNFAMAETILFKLIDTEEECKKTGIDVNILTANIFFDTATMMRGNI